MGLNAAGVHHDPNGATQAGRGQVGAELGLHNTSVAMGTHDLAPDAAEVGALLQGGGLVHIGEPLASVEVSLLLGHNAIDLNEGGVVLLVCLAPLVPKDGTLNVQPDALATHFDFRRLTTGKPGQERALLGVRLRICSQLGKLEASSQSSRSASHNVTLLVLMGGCSKAQNFHQQKIHQVAVCTTISTKEEH